MSPGSGREFPGEDERGDWSSPPSAAPGDWSGPAGPPPAAAPKGGRLAAARRRREPHNRRAQAGQATGLAPEQESALPSWLTEERVSVAPARRLLSFSVAGFAALLAFGLVVGAHTVPGSYGLVVFGAQFLFVLAWTAASRPEGPRVVIGIGLVAAALADVGAVLAQQPSLAPLGYVTVGGFVAGVIAQLARGQRRLKVTESLGATLIVVVGVVAYASLVVLSRHLLGTESIVVCLTAAGVALVVARLTDIVLPRPRTSSQVSRGSIGVVLGAMAGTALAGLVGSALVGIGPRRAVVAGLVTAMAAILADLAISYAEAGREIDGAPPRLWLARHLQGPLAALGLAAPAAYVLSVMFLVPAL
jgi:hypothetical protein